MIDDKDRERLHDWIDGRLSESEAREFARRVAADRELSSEHAELTRLVSQLSSLRGERAPSGFAAAVVAAAGGSSAASSSAGGARAGGAPRLPTWLAVVLPIAATLLIGVFAFQYVAIERLDATAPATERAQFDESNGTVTPPRFEDEKHPASEAGEEAKRESSWDPPTPAGSSEATPAAPAARDDESTTTRIGTVRTDKPAAETSAEPGADGAAVERKKSAVTLGSSDEDRLSDARAASGEGVLAPGYSASGAPGAPGAHGAPADGETAAEPGVTVWRVTRAAPPIVHDRLVIHDRLAKSNERSDADRRFAAADKKLSELTTSLPIPDELRAAIEAIRAVAPERVLLVDLDEAARTEFLANAARSGFVVEEFVATSPQETPKEDVVDQDVSAAPPASLAVFARAANWKSVALPEGEADASKNSVALKSKDGKHEAGGGPPAPGGRGPTTSGGGPTTPGGGTGSVVGGGGGGVPIPGGPGFGAKPGSVAEKPAGRGGASQSAGAGTKLAEEPADGQLTKRGIRLLIVYEFEPPR